MGQNGLFSESYFKTENNYDVNNKSNASPTNINVDSDVNLFESKDAVTEIGIKHEVLNQFDILFCISWGVVWVNFFFKSTFNLEFLNFAYVSTKKFHESVLWHICLSNSQPVFTIFKHIVLATILSISRSR